MVQIKTTLRQTCWMYTQETVAHYSWNELWKIQGPVICSKTHQVKNIRYCTWCTHTFGMYNLKVLWWVLFYVHVFFSLHIHDEHYNVTQLQHVLLGILSVRQQPLKESVAKAVGYGWKVHLHCLPIPVEEMKSNRANTTAWKNRKLSP